MRTAYYRSFLVATALVLSTAGLNAARAADEGAERAALAKALAGAKVTLQSGIKASESQGKPISAKFEVEDGKLQLSVYTMKGNRFSEVVIDPQSGKRAKVETITDKGDLDDAAAQKAAMDRAKTSLHAAVDKAVKANAGSRAVSVMPALKEGRPVAEVVLLRAGAHKSVLETLD